MPSPSTSPGRLERHPVLPLRDLVVFPHMIVPLFVGRESSIRAVRAAMQADRPILLATQTSAQDDDPGLDAIHRTGTLTAILQVLDLPDATVKVLVEGRARARVHRYVRSDFYEAEAETLADDTTVAPELASAVLAAFGSYVKSSTTISGDIPAFVAEIEDHSMLADVVASHFPATIADKQGLLETTSVAGRLATCLALIEAETAALRDASRETGEG